MLGKGLYTTCKALVLTITFNIECIKASSKMWNFLDKIYIDGLYDWKKYIKYNLQGISMLLLLLTLNASKLTVK